MKPEALDLHLVPKLQLLLQAKSSQPLSTGGPNHACHRAVGIMDLDIVFAPPKPQMLELA